MNEGDTICRFLQVWIKPDERGVTPQYGSQTYEAADRHNQWLHLLGGTGALPRWTKITNASSVRLHQDCNVMVTECDPNVRHHVTVSAGRRMYMVCMEGGLTVNHELEMTDREALEVVAPTEDKSMTLTANDTGMHVMAIEMSA